MLTETEIELIRQYYQHPDPSQVLINAMKDCFVENDHEFLLGIFLAGNYNDVIGQRFKNVCLNEYYDDCVLFELMDEQKCYYGKEPTHAVVNLPVRSDEDDDSFDNKLIEVSNADSILGEEIIAYAQNEFELSDEEKGEADFEYGEEILLITRNNIAKVKYRIEVTKPEASTVFYRTHPEYADKTTKIKGDWKRC